MNLIKAETSRLLARRVTWITLVLALLGCALALFGNWQSIQPPSPEMKAQIARDYEEYKTQWEQHKNEICGTDQECLKAPMPIEKFGHRALSFNESMRNMALAGSYFSFLAAMVMGASVLAAEFVTGSITNLLSFVPNRTRVFSAKLLVTTLASTGLGVLVIGFITAGTTIEYLAAQGAALTVGAEEALQLAGRGVALAVIGGVLGYALAVLLRHTAAVVGLVLGYVFFLGLLDTLIRLIDKPALFAYTPEANLNAIVAGRHVAYYYAPQLTPTPETIPPLEIVVTWQQGAIYWTLLLAALTATAWFVFKRRDVA